MLNVRKIVFDSSANTMGTSNVDNKHVGQHGIKKLNRDQEELNPCFKEYNLSAKCLERNLCDYDECRAYFKNYNNCKKFWAQIVSNRKRNNIKPDIPLPKDREKIKAEYLSSKH